MPTEDEFTADEIEARTRVAIKCMCRMPLTPEEEAIRKDISRGFVRIDEDR